MTLIRPIRRNLYSHGWVWAAALLLIVLFFFSDTSVLSTPAFVDEECSESAIASSSLNRDLPSLAGQGETPVVPVDGIALAGAGGKPSVGLNKFDLFLQYLGRASGGDGSANYRKVTRAMAQKAITDARYIGINYFRVSATGYSPSVFDREGDLTLWRNDPDLYWCRFDEMINDLNRNGIKLIPVFVWNWVQFPAMAGESATEMMTDPESDSYRLLTQYIHDFITRYRNHPSIYFYELTNELNLRADLDMVQRCLEASNGAISPCNPVGNFSTDQMIAFTKRLADYVRSLDSTRPISSGFSLPRPVAEHLRTYPEYSPDRPPYVLDSLTQFQKNLADIHAGVDIVSIHFYNRNDNHARFGITGTSNAGLLDIVKQTTDELGKELFVGEFGDSNAGGRDGETAEFTKSVLDKIVALKIPYSAAWVWQFYQHTPYSTYSNQHTFFNLEPGYTDLVIAQIQEANEVLGNSASVAATPDTIPPQVIVTWPLEGTVLACSQLVHAVASDNGGAVAGVEFLVGGEVKAEVAEAPYQFQMDVSQLPMAKQEIKARAYDLAGNVGEYTVSAIPQLCLAERLFMPQVGNR